MNGNGAAQANSPCVQLSSVNESNSMEANNHQEIVVQKEKFEFAMESGAMPARSRDT